MYKDLKNKKIIITGSATGIGKSVTARLCAFGAKVAALDINKEKGSETVFNAIEYGGDIKFFEIDVKNEISVKKNIQEATSWLGGIDVLIHIAGILEGADTEINNFPEDIWNKVIDVNLRGSFLVAKYVSKIMIKNGIEPKRINVAGYGEFRPLVENVNNESRNKNRRIELKLTQP